MARAGGRAAGALYRPGKPARRRPRPYSDLARNQKFESTPLQRRVTCEPEFSGGHRIDPGRRGSPQGDRRASACHAALVQEARHGRTGRIGTRYQMASEPLLLESGKGARDLADRRAALGAEGRNAHDADHRDQADKHAIFDQGRLAPGATANIADSPDCEAVGIACHPQFTVMAAARNSLAWINRVLRELDSWIARVPHGLHREHLPSYLDEFVFRFDTRRDRNAAFTSLLGIATTDRPLSYKMLVHQKQQRNVRDSPVMCFASACFPLGTLLECCELLPCGSEIFGMLLA